MFKIELVSPLASDSIESNPDLVQVEVHKVTFTFPFITLKIYTRPYFPYFHYFLGLGLGLFLESAFRDKGFRSKKGRNGIRG